MLVLLKIADLLSISVSNDHFNNQLINSIRKTGMGKWRKAELVILFYIFLSKKHLTQHPRKLTRKKERYNWGKALILKAISLCHNLDTSISD